MSAKRKSRRVVAFATPQTAENQADLSTQELANAVVQALEIARKIVEKLAAARIQNKMTASRATAVAKEIKELVKVIAIYK